MQVTIILDSGGFLIDENTGRGGPLNVGYFEAPGHDIEVRQDSNPLQALAAKLGNKNEHVHVEHVDTEGGVKTDVVREASFKQDILRKNELFPVDTPDFLPDEYDCILHFHSGIFKSFDVRDRVFHEHRLSDDSATGNTHPTGRKIANDVLVEFQVEKGEELRLRNSIGILWSSSWAGSAQQVSVKLRADGALDKNYFRKALKHKGPNYKLPNPDPPPMNGNDPGAGGG
jgi:hypothetical protein